MDTGTKGKLAVDRLVVLRLAIREDGSLSITSESGVDGLHLASIDHAAVWRDLGMAMQLLLAKNHQWPTATSQNETVN